MYLLVDPFLEYTYLKFRWLAF